MNTELQLALMQFAVYPVASDPGKANPTID